MLKIGMGSWKLTCVDVRTYKNITCIYIYFLWLISFVWTSKNFKWNNNTCCSKMKTIWKLIFPDHFILFLALFTKTRLNISRPLDVKLTDSFSEMLKRMVIKQLISVSGYIRIPYNLYCPSVRKDINKQICKENLSKLG